MKIQSFLLGILIIAFLSSCDCHKQDDALHQRATVIKDCTSSYLRVDEKYYLICNEEEVASYEHNSSICATFDRQDGCLYTGNCYKEYAYEHSIQITNIAP